MNEPIRAAAFSLRGAPRDLKVAARGVEPGAFPRGYCRYCGSQNPRGARFCKCCGAAFSPDTRRAWWWVLPTVVLLATYVTFRSALDGDFVNWDDEANLVYNPHVRALGPDQLRWMWTSTLLGVWEPLSWMVKAAQAVAGGMTASTFHRVSLALHLASTLLFYLVCQRLLRGAVPDPAADGAGLRLAAAAAAFVFAVHPLRAETVAWVTAQPYVLAVFFTLACVLAYLSSVESSGPGAGRVWYGVSVLCAALAMLSKAAAMPLPVVLTVLDVYPLRLLGGRRGWLTPAARRVWLVKLPYYALGLATAVAATWATGSSPPLLRLVESGPPERVAAVLFGFAFCLGKSLIPLGLSPYYPLPARVHAVEAQFILSALLVVGLTTLVVALRRRWPAGLAAWTCYVLYLVPVVGILQHGSQLAADRYSYLSCLSLGVLLSGAVFCLWRRRGSLRPAAVAALSIGSVCTAVALGFMTWRQAGVWQDSGTLWRHALRIDPQSTFARLNLGIYLHNNVGLEPAIEQYEAALRLNPQDAKAHSNLAAALIALGRFGEAIEHASRAIELMPTLASAHHNLSLAMTQTGRSAEAEAAAREAIRHQRDNARLYHSPETPDPYASLGVALFKQGRFEEAITAFEQALRINPAFEDARVNLGAAHYNLGVALARQGRRAEAVRHLRAALAINPDHAGVRAALGALEAQPETGG